VKSLPEFKILLGSFPFEIKGKKSWHLFLVWSKIVFFVDFITTLQKY